MKRYHFESAYVPKTWTILNEKPSSDEDRQRYQRGNPDNLISSFLF